MQGAPLAPIYHQALSVRDRNFPIVVLSCGGIANITVITGEGASNFYMHIYKIHFQKETIQKWGLGSKDMTFIN